MLHFLLRFNHYSHYEQLCMLTLPLALLKLAKLRWRMPPEHCTGAAKSALALAIGCNFGLRNLAMLWAAKLFLVVSV